MAHLIKQSNRCDRRRFNRYLINMSVIAAAVFSNAAGLIVSAEQRPLVVMMVAESEYKTEKTLPRFAEEHLQSQYRVSIITEQPNQDGVMMDLSNLDDADVLLVSMRRKTLPPEQLQSVRDYVAAGKPVIGIRTASHAFCLRNKPAPDGRADWPEFDAEVFGGNYTNHYGNNLKSTITMNPSASAHPILRGISNTPFEQGGSLYKTSPLDTNANALLTGETDGHPPEPIAWTFERPDGGASFYTSL